MTIEHWDPERDGALTEENFRRRLERQGYRCSIYAYPPGTRFPDHEHAVVKVDGVLQGRFRIAMDGRSWILEPGDSIRVPRGRIHSAEVVGSETVISIDAVRD